jgi:hypothetical protein
MLSLCADAAKAAGQTRPRLDAHKKSIVSAAEERMMMMR